MPLSIQSNPLPTLQQQRLSEYLRRDEALTLLKVADAKAIQLDAGAINDKGEAMDNPKFNETVERKKQAAQRYHNFVSVLKELMQETAHYTITLRQD